MKLNAIQILDISTAHLSEASIKWMADAAKIQRLGMMERDQGFFIGSSFAGKAEQQTDIPADLWHCLRFAEANGASYVLFDQSAELQEGLPVYDGNTAEVREGQAGQLTDFVITRANGAILGTIKAVDPETATRANLKARKGDPVLEDGDYVIESGIWLGAGPASIRVIHDENEVRVTVLPRGFEMEPDQGELVVSCADLEAAIAEVKAQEELESPGL